MNNNFEAIKSLISLLVKKSGFDLESTTSETELEKTKNSIKELSIKKDTSNNKKAISNIIETLKLKEAYLENNAEIVGQSLIKAYKEDKSYNAIKHRIELLGNLALKGTENLSASTLYTKISTLENNYNKLNEKINTYEYKNINELEMDERYKTYLENKIDSLDKELSITINELDSLRDAEIKDINIVNKIKEYIEKLDNDINRITKALNITANSNVTFDVIKRLENVQDEIEKKTSNAKEVLVKAENMLSDVRSNRTNYNERKSTLEEELNKLKNKLNNVNIKLEENNYTNQIEKIIDINELEKIKLEIDSLKNKKDVLYVDALKVKEELIKEWTNKPTEISEIKEESIEETPYIEPTVETPTIEEPKIEEVKKEEKKNKRIELDW